MEQSAPFFMGKILLCLLVVLCSASSSFALDPGSYGAFVREHYTYRKGLEVLNSPAGRLSIAGAAQLLPAAAAATGVTLSAGVTLPLAAMVMGTAWIAQDVYDRQAILRDINKPPVYSELNTSAGPTDYISLPVHVTDTVETVTPESFPQATAQLVGRPAYASVPLADFLRHLVGLPPGTADSLKDIAVNSVELGPPNMEMMENPVGKIFEAENGKLYEITGAANTWMFEYYDDERTDPYMMSISGTVRINGWRAWKLGNQANIYAMSSRLGSYYKGQNYMFDVFPCRVVQSGTIVEPPEKPVLYEQLKQALKDFFQSNPAEVGQVVQSIAQSSPSDVAITDEAPALADPQPRVQTGPISQTELNNFYTTNASNVTNYATTQTTSTSTIQEIAQNQAAVDAAKQAAPEFPESATFHGDAALPDANDYSFELEEVPEQNLVERIHGLIDQGLPVLSVMQSSGLTASGDPSISAEIYGRDITVDFSDYASIFHTMGIMLTFCSVVLSYRIVVGS